MAANVSKRHNIACAAHQLVTRRIAELMRERAKLEEEVLQLRVAVQIWTAVAEQTVVPSDANGSMSIHHN